VGYNTATQQLNKLVWYKKGNVLLYPWRAVKELAPFKVPEAVKRLTLEKNSVDK
jgi:hypothetical protein